ncbi:MFS general substrate transporter, partial [Corynespora cassiicola Philippines]
MYGQYVWTAKIYAYSACANSHCCVPARLRHPHLPSPIPMKAARYSVSRKKSCLRCSAAKEKCDRKPERCSRCASRGLRCIYSQAMPPRDASIIPERTKTPEGFNAHHLANLELVCPIDAGAISNRWLNSYIPAPGQKNKEYSKSTASFIFRILKSYASVTVHGRAVPPFIHPAQTKAAFMKPPLATCLAIVRICKNPLPGSEGTILDVLQREMNSLYNQREVYDDMSSLTAFQAYLIYSMVLFFLLKQNNNLFLRQAIMNLQELACSSSHRGLVCKAEQQHARPQWEAWIIAEAKRRTLYTMYFFDNVLSTQDGIPITLGSELQGLPAPTSQYLWRAETRYEWEEAYNLHLTDWKDCFRIDELWPLPTDLDDHGVAERRGRVDRWLEGVDEFGTMLYAVTNVSHTMASLGNTNMPDTDQHLQATVPRAPEQPYSIFDKRQKALIVAIISTAATFSGFASNIYFPAIPTIAHDLHVSTELINLTVTSYLIFQGLAPSLWGPLSDAKGRRTAYFCTFIVFLGSCIGLAESKNYTTLLVLRCLQSTGSASTIAIGSGVIGDITTRAERGGYMSVFQAGMLAPVAIGPIIGGALSGSLGWKSVFWFLGIYSGVFLVLLLFLLPETLRSLVGNGDVKPQSQFLSFPLFTYQSLSTTPRTNFRKEVDTQQKKLKVDLTTPLRILFSPLAGPPILALAILYAAWQTSLTILPPTLTKTYSLTATQTGLAFIPNGLGSIFGTLLAGRMLDRSFQRAKEKLDMDMEARGQQHNADPDDERQGEVATAPGDTKALLRARLTLLPPLSLLLALALILQSWTLNFKTHISIPLIASFATGWAAAAAQSVVTTYLIDAHPKHAAAAGAALNLCRCLIAAGATAGIGFVVEAIGVGWTGVVVVGCVGI